MKIIDNQYAKKISDWCEKHVKESKAYFKKHAKLSQLFINKEISYDEFKKQSDKLKSEYKFLEEETK